MSESNVIANSVWARVQPKKVLVLCPFPHGVAAGQRFKYEQFFNHWRENGYDIEVSSFMDNRLWEVVYKPGHYLGKFLGVLRGYGRRIRDMMRVRDFDIVYVFMWVTPFGTNMFERLTRRLAKGLVYDIEDRIYVGPEPAPSTSPNPVARLLKGPHKARFLIQAADHVIAASPFITKDCEGLNKDHAATYVPPSMDTGRLTPKTVQELGHKVTLGWTGTFSTKIYLDSLRSVLRRLAERRAFRLLVIGNFDYTFEGIDLKVVQWSPDREVQDLQEIDIGIYPLPMDDDWVFGKSGLKALQYMAVGVPTVATNVGSTPMVVRHGHNGLLVKTEEQWLEALEQLIDDSELRRRLGANGRRTVVENYSIQAVRQKYLAILDNVVGVPAPP
jgi:glycosyltransferase involved in cell wall biosynthesis